MRNIKNIKATTKAATKPATVAKPDAKTEKAKTEKAAPKKPVRGLPLKNGDTLTIVSTSKPAGDALHPLSPSDITAGRIGTGSARCSAYIAAYKRALADVASIPCIGDKAVTSSLIEAGFLAYDKANHTLSAGDKLKTASGAETFTDNKNTYTLRTVKAAS